MATEKETLKPTNAALEAFGKYLLTKGYPLPKGYTFPDEDKDADPKLDKYIPFTVGETSGSTPEKGKAEGPSPAPASTPKRSRPPRAERAKILRFPSRFPDLTPTGLPFITDDINIPEEKETAVMATEFVDASKTPLTGTTVAAATPGVGVFAQPSAPTAMLTPPEIIITSETETSQPKMDA